MFKELFEIFFVWKFRFGGGVTLWKNPRFIEGLEPDPNEYAQAVILLNMSRPKRNSK